jgi:hypothetical protein
MVREVKDILKDLCSFESKTANPMDRLPHDCYMVLVGRIRTQEHFEMLLEMNEAQGITSGGEEDENQAEYAVLNSEDVESILEYIKLEGRTEKLENQRRSHIVYEDNFNSSLIGLIESESTYRKLKDVCQRYEKKETVRHAMAEHETRVKQSHSYFCEKDLPTDEAKALAFSISFYTGTKSEACNRGASLIARKGNGQVIEQGTEEEISEAAIILYYLVKALSYIPFYWGYVTRACQLTYDELKIYKPGCLITWIQFSSSKKGKKVLDSDAFKNRNTLFKIFSLTGRPIQQFSNYPEEDEVLFLPHSTFLVFNRKTHYEEGKQVIYMRQVELGLCKWSVLWVDDRIFDEKWENKEHMEYAAAKALDMNVHFIPKSTTETALSFLRSDFGQRLKNKDTFRIVTDMNREKEKPTHNAGARLIKAVRQMGFKNECLIFTSDKRKAEKIIESELNSKEQQCVRVSQNTADLRNFVNFDRKSASAQHSNSGNSSKSNASQHSTYSSKFRRFISLTFSCLLLNLTFLKDAPLNMIDLMTLDVHRRSLNPFLSYASCRNRGTRED